MKRIFYLLFFLPTLIIAQVGIGNTNPQATLDITASSASAPANNDGILIPRVNNFPAANPTVNQNGMLVFATGAGVPTQGFYYWDNSIPAWVPLLGAKRIDDLTDGKSDVDGSDDGSSVFLGINSGDSDDSADRQNVGVGFQTLQNSVTGNNNVAIGYRSLRVNTATRNTAVGHTTLSSNTTGSNNTALGGQSLSSNTTGDSNVSIGAFSLAKNTVGKNNNSIGNQALRFNVFGDNNTALGDYAGRALDLDNLTDFNNDRNVYIGSQAGDSDHNSSNNVYIGYQAGAGNYIPANNTNPATGTLEDKSGNVFIGYQAGKSENSSDKLIISNSDTDITTSLIYGNFNNNKLRINDYLGIGKNATTNALEVQGEASKTTAGAFIANSDRRLKTNIKTIEGETALDKLTQLRGVTYEWNDVITGNERPKGIQYGFIAQELMEVFPEKVTKDGLGYYQTAYGDYDAFFVQAIKELNNKVQNLESENLELKRQLNILHSIEARISALENNDSTTNNSILLTEN